MRHELDVGGIFGAEEEVRKLEEQDGLESLEIRKEKLIEKLAKAGYETYFDGDWNGKLVSTEHARWRNVAKAMLEKLDEMEEK